MWNSEAELRTIAPQLLKYLVRRVPRCSSGYDALLTEEQTRGEGEGPCNKAMHVSRVTFMRVDEMLT